MDFVYFSHARRSYFLGASLGLVSRSNVSSQVVASSQDHRGIGLPFRVTIGICRHSGNVHRTCQSFEDARLSSRPSDFRSLDTLHHPLPFIYGAFEVVCIFGTIMALTNSKDIRACSYMTITVAISTTISLVKYVTCIYRGCLQCRRGEQE